MSPAVEDIATDVGRLLRAGFAEAAGGYREEFEPFIGDFAPLLATLAWRAQQGDTDDARAAKLSLEMLGQQALTHKWIADVKAQGVATKQIKLFVGQAVRLLMP